MHEQAEICLIWSGKYHIQPKTAQKKSFTHISFPFPFLFGLPAGDGILRKFVVLLPSFAVLPHQMLRSPENSGKTVFAIVANHPEIVDVLFETYISSGIVFFILHPMHIICYVQSGRNVCRTSRPRVLRAAALSHEGVMGFQGDLGGRLASPWSLWPRRRRNLHSIYKKSSDL